MTLLDRAAILSGLLQLDIPAENPVVIHASLSAFGRVEGGAQHVVGALLDAWRSVVAPVFTYKTMIIPEVGPAENGIQYGSGAQRNRLAEFYRPDMPADRLIGAIAETLRRHPQAQRSRHPILSFTGVNAAPILSAQTLVDPLAPLRMLHEADGWVILMGVDHAVNTSIHYAEKLAGRQAFMRWALTTQGVVACPQFPGCSDGFDALAPTLEQVTRRVQIGRAYVQAVSIEDVILATSAQLQNNPLALLCDRSYCERCEAQRHRLIKPLGGPQVEQLCA